jgi:hypothetical protein
VDGKALTGEASAWRSRPRAPRSRPTDLDLAALTRMADSLPLEAALRTQLAQLAPQGKVHCIELPAG